MDHRIELINSDVNEVKISKKQSWHNFIFIFLFDKTAKTPFAHVRGRIEFILHAFKKYSSRDLVPSRRGTVINHYTYDYAHERTAAKLCLFNPPYWREPLNSPRKSCADRLKSTAEVWEKKSLTLTSGKGGAGRGGGEGCDCDASQGQLGCQVT
jgi:hypothetical protein